MLYKLLFDVFVPSSRSLFQCMKCTYATCCKVGMNTHMATMHEVKRSRKNTQRKRIPLPKPLYCVCGFSSSCGNNMGKFSRIFYFYTPVVACAKVRRFSSLSFGALQPSSRLSECGTCCAVFGSNAVGQFSGAR